MRRENYEQKVENLLREKIKDDVVLIIALKIKSAIMPMINNGEIKTINYIQSEKLASGIVYLSFIKTNQVKSLGEISNMFELTRRDVGRTYNKIKRALGINFCKREKMSMMGTSCVIQRMPKDFLVKIKISDKSKKYATQILKKIENNQNFQGKSPSVICAAAVYVALLMNGDFKSQREVADLFGTTETGLRMRYKQIIDELALEEKLKLTEWEKHRKEYLKKNKNETNKF